MMKFRDHGGAHGNPVGQRPAGGCRAFLGGAQPLYADYAIFGSFQWCRCISDFPLLAPDDPVYAWRGRMLALYDGLAGKAKGYPV